MDGGGKQLNGGKASANKGEGRAKVTGPAPSVVTDSIISILEVVNLDHHGGHLLPVIDPFRVDWIAVATLSGGPSPRPRPLYGSTRRTRDLLGRLLEYKKIGQK